MNNAHISGGTIAALITYVSAKYGWGVSTDEALTFGAALAAVGAGVAHFFQPPGLVPRVKALLGVSAAPAPPAA